MDPFPFFLSYFPVTADVLSQELTQLLKDPQRNAWWEEALMLLRQSYEATHVLTYGWDLDGESQLATLVDQLVSSIPEDTDLWRCFGLEPWLRIALEDALGWDALGAAFPHNLKMLRCAPDNPIWLYSSTSLTTPFEYYDPRTTQAHRDQVDAYVKAIRAITTRGRARGPEGFDTYDAFVDLLVTVAREVKRVDPAIRQQTVATYLVEHGPRLQRYSAKQPDSTDIDIHNKCRWIRKHLKVAGLTWSVIQKRARIS
jgi:hypothetical protein